MIDYARLITQGFESKELDYKDAMLWDEKNNRRGCCGLVKDILALANSGGGWLIIGVEETNGVFSRKGLTEEQHQSFETTRLNRFLNNYADPPINTKIHKNEYDGRWFVLIEVPPFPDTPHICQKDYPDELKVATIYVRTANNESAPLKNSADFRGIIERSVRNRSDQLLSSMRTILTHGVQPPGPTDIEKFQEQITEIAKRCDGLNPHKKKNYAYRETAFFPATFASERFDLPSLWTMAKNASISHRGWPFIFISENRPDLTHEINDGYETFEADPHLLSGGDTLHFWQLRRTGLLYTKELLWEDTHRSTKGGNRYLDFDGFSMTAGEAIECLIRLYERQLDDSDDVTLQFKLVGMRDRPLGSSNPHRYTGRLGLHVCQIDKISYEARHPLADWRAGLVDHALDLCNYVFQRFGWMNPNLAESGSLIEKTLARRL